MTAAQRAVTLIIIRDEPLGYLTRFFNEGSLSDSGLIVAGGK